MEKFIAALDGVQAYFLAAIAGLVWFVRLESNVALNRAEVERMRVQRAEDMQTAADTRDQDLKAAADLRREQNDLLREMRADIKTILKGSHE